MFARGWVNWNIQRGFIRIDKNEIQADRINRDSCSTLLPFFSENLRCSFSISKNSEPNLVKMASYVN